MGLRLPRLLRQVYEQVGNGGFGPGYGLFGLPTSAGDEKESAVGRYRMLHRLQTDPPWPLGLLPLCDWGVRHRLLPGLFAPGRAGRPAGPRYAG